MKTPHRCVGHSPFSAFMQAHPPRPREAEAEDDDTHREIVGGMRWGFMASFVLLLCIGSFVGLAAMAAWRLS